jgi:DNA polymerase III subunit epsilon
MVGVRPVPPSRIYRRRPWRDAPLAALDFETTGLDLRRDSIVSFGVVPVQGGQVLLHRSAYREVAPSAPLTHASIAIHQLRPVDLADAPDVDRARAELAEALDRRYVLAWVAEVETGFLARLFRTPRWTWRRRTVDVARLWIALERLEGRRASRSVSLVAACGQHGVPVESAHNALDDAAMTAQLFLVIATKLARFGGYDALGALLRENGRHPYDV